MKKLLCSLLLVTIMFNFIVCNYSNAGETTSSDATSPMKDAFDVDVEEASKEEGTEEDAVVSSSGKTSILEEGETEQTNGSGTKVSTNSSMAGISMVGVIVGYLALIIDIIPLQIQFILSELAYTGSTTGYFVTMEKIVFNKVALFNINYFDTSDEYTVASDTITASQHVNTMKKSITQFYYIDRILAMCISLLVLIYIGIRMALSTLATDKAKYKKMLMSWVESIVLLFLMQYLMAIIILVGEALTEIFASIEDTLVATSGGSGFELDICNTLVNAIFETSGLRLAMYSLMYWVVIYMQIKFFYLYLKRLLVVGWLIILAPLVTITYSIDKVGDGQAQAFSSWMREFLMNVLIQPLHAVLYLIFMFTAGAIAEYAPLVAILFMMSMGQAERMVKVVFNMKGLVSLRGVDKFRKKQE